MSSTTKYSIQLHTDGEWVTKETRSAKDAAIKLADELHAKNAGIFASRVVTEAGTVVHEQDAVVEHSDDEDAAVTVARTKPWTRTAEAKFEAPVIEGYELAYTRSRIKTGVYRANDKSGWLVVDTRTGTRTEHENTKLARERTNELAAEYVASQADVKAKALADKAEAKQAKDAARAEAKAQAEKEKTAKAEAKAAEKAAKAAATEATAEATTAA